MKLRSGTRQLGLEVLGIDFWVETKDTNDGLLFLIMQVSWKGPGGMLFQVKNGDYNTYKDSFRSICFLLTQNKILNFEHLRILFIPSFFKEKTNAKNDQKSTQFFS